MNEPAEPTLFPSQDAFDPEEHVEQLFNEFNSKLSGTPQSSATKAEESPSDLGNTSTATSETAGESADLPAASTAPDEVAVWQKRYNDLQSDMDRRVNKGVESLRNELSAKFDTLITIMSRGGAGQPQAPETFSDAISDEAKAQQYFDRLVKSNIAQALNSDPRVAAGQMVQDSAKFQQAHPDWQNFLPVIEPALKWFPVKSGESAYERLEQVYEFAKDLYAQAQAAAKAPGGAVRANTAQPTTPQPNGVRVTGEQQAALRARQNAYANETGVSAVANTKPNIDPFDHKIPLEAKVRALLGSQIK